MTTYGQWEMGSSEFLMSPKGYAFNPEAMILELSESIKKCWTTAKAIAPLFIAVLALVSLMVGLVASRISSWSPGWSTTLVEISGWIILLIVLILIWIAFGPPHQRPHDNYGNFQGDTMKRKQSKLSWKARLCNVVEDMLIWGVVLCGWVTAIALGIIGVALLLWLKVIVFGWIVIGLGVVTFGFWLWANIDLSRHTTSYEE